MTHSYEFSKIKRLSKTESTDRVENPRIETQVFIKILVNKWLGLTNELDGSSSSPCIYEGPRTSQVVEFPITKFYFSSSSSDEDDSVNNEYPFGDIDALALAGFIGFEYSETLKKILTDFGPIVVELAMETKSKKIEIFIDIRTIKLYYEEDDDHDHDHKKLKILMMRMLEVVMNPLMNEAAAYNEQCHDD
ncbi:hypothetical protein BVC80_8707g2 [Macleaya cordata]|uniref:Uncharacterized protein n=1 Tax=Macleaya cordata TaxID=56857 RepID=A0A200Q148_MACCD|nr:hypothetical protein BVC80_8707g2 [Macleaya cordata]